MHTAHLKLVCNYINNYYNDNNAHTAHLELVLRADEIVIREGAVRGQVNQDGVGDGTQVHLHTVIH